MGTLAGALGSNFDSPESIREATYSRRYHQRRELFDTYENEQADGRPAPTEPEGSHRCRTGGSGSRAGAPASEGSAGRCRALERSEPRCGRGRHVRRTDRKVARGPERFSACRREVRTTTEKAA